MATARAATWRIRARRWPRWTTRRRRGSVDAADRVRWATARYVPGFGDARQREARAYNAAVLYWERDYDALVPGGQDPVAAIEEGNTDLQLVVANAAYRKNQDALHRHGGHEAGPPGVRVRTI